MKWLWNIVWRIICITVWNILCKIPLKPITWMPWFCTPRWCSAGARGRTTGPRRSRSSATAGCWGGRTAATRWPRLTASGRRSSSSAASPAGCGTGGPWRPAAACSPPRAPRGPSRGSPWPLGSTTSASAGRWLSAGGTRWRGCRGVGAAPADDSLFWRNKFH